MDIKRRSLFGVLAAVAFTKPAIPQLKINDEKDSSPVTADHTAVERVEGKPFVEGYITITGRDGKPRLLATIA